MSDTRPAGTARVLAPRADIPADELLPLTVRYPKGLCCEVLRSNKHHVERAAIDTGIEISFVELSSERRKSKNDYLAVYTDLKQFDPTAMVKLYLQYLVDALVERRVLKEGANVTDFQTPAQTKRKAHRQSPSKRTPSRRPTRLRRVPYPHGD